jgi:hypothetical protein
VPPNVPLLFVDKIIEVMDEKEYPHFLILKETSLYKLLDKTAVAYLKDYFKLIGDLQKNKRIKEGLTLTSKIQIFKTFPRAINIKRE